MVTLLVSACLLGEKCRYDGSANVSNAVLAYVKDKEVVSVCPEVLGGLHIPRNPCEIIAGCVKDQKGNDLSVPFLLGAQKAFKIFSERHCTEAILKSRSPSCGLKYIYDGTFQRKLVRGSGVFATLLKENKICIYDEEDIAKKMEK